MKQLISIHGATTFKHYEAYLEHLRNKPLHPERMTAEPMWREMLQKNLGNEYQVLLPSMPNKTNARYSEWKIWFTHILELAQDGLILVGHSMGAVFLAKYLSEETLPVRVKATFLVAAPHSEESLEDLGDFAITGDLSGLKQQGGNLHFFFGNNDPVIPAIEQKRYQAELPSATYTVLPAPDHFMRPDFPELIEAIRALE